MNQELYFVAIVFEGSIGSQINSIKQQMFSSYQSKAALNSPPHLTLHMPFKRKAKDETAIANCVDQACENIHPFEIKFNGFNCFEPRVIYLDVHGSDKLRELHSKVQAALTKGLKVTNSLYKGLPFKPHVTVAFRDLRKQKFQTAWNDFKDKPFFDQAMCSEVCLLKHSEKKWRVIYRSNLGGRAIKS